MKPISIAAATLIFAATATAQVVTTVIGTGDPNVDIPAVQAAVDQGGQVILKGRFSFDAPPTVPEAPIIGFNGGTGMGTILVVKPVSISGALDDQRQLTTIVGGTTPFYVDASGASVAIQGLHFIHPKGGAVFVAAVAGLSIAYNRIEG